MKKIYFAAITLTLIAVSCNKLDDNIGLDTKPGQVTGQSILKSATISVTSLKVGIYSGTGAESGTILALFRAVASMGYTPMALTGADITAGRLTRTNFDVLIIPPGEDGKTAGTGHYSDGAVLNQTSIKNGIRTFVTGGGGLVAEEAGSYFSSQNNGTLSIYTGSYTNVTNQIGKKSFTITDSRFGTGIQEAWHSYGGGYFSSTPSSATVVATNASNQAVIVRQGYGSGRLILTSFTLELRGDSETDWTIWDNWAMGGVHKNSVGVWTMLGRMINWAYNGNPSAPSINSTANSAGSRVAVIAQHTTNGGAWPGLLPAVGRGIENCGHLPLAIRFQEVKDGRLTTANFKVVTFPGGDAYGYKMGITGYESGIRNFISAGGSYYGICAGAFYAASTVVWSGKSTTYPLAIFSGKETGPITDIIAWPGYKLTPVTFSGDAVIGTFGTINVMYYGGGYHTIPTDAVQGSHVYTAGTFSTSSAIGKADLVRYTYGKGRVALTTTHLETLAGANNDWLFWDNYDYKTGSAVTNTTHCWDVMGAIFNNWLTLP